MRITVEGRSFYLTEHALWRYQERVKPALDDRQAVADLNRVLSRVGAVTDKPDWAFSVDGIREWVMLGRDIAFPVGKQSRLITCVTRLYPGEEARAERAEKRRRKDPDGFSPKRRKQHGKVQRGERARARRRQELRDG